MDITCGICNEFICECVKMKFGARDFYVERNNIVTSLEHCLEEPLACAITTIQNAIINLRWLDK